MKYKVVKLSKIAQSRNEPYKYEVKLGTRIIDMFVNKTQAIARRDEYNRNVQSNPGAIMKKLRKGIRGFIKVSRGKLIIKT